MIRWTEQPPEPTIRPIDELLGDLSVTDSALLWQACRDGPIVLVKPECKRLIDEHVREGRTELGGLLLGRVYTLGSNGQDPCLIAIRRAIASRDFDATGVSLRMDTGVWDAARDAQDADGEIVIGWYHSHPNLGAFFSSTDRMTQERFFAHSYSIGLVVDPVRHDEKWFLGPQAIEVVIRRIIMTDLIAAP